MEGIIAFRHPEREPCLQGHCEQGSLSGCRNVVLPFIQLWSAFLPFCSLLFSLLCMGTWIFFSTKWAWKMPHSHWTASFSSMCYHSSLLRLGLRCHNYLILLVLPPVCFRSLCVHTLRYWKCVSSDVGVLKSTKDACQPASIFTHCSRLPHEVFVIPAF